MDPDRLTELLARHRLAAAIATSPENIRYATGFATQQGVWNRNPKAVIVGPHSRPTLVLPAVEAGYVFDGKAHLRAEIRLFGSNNVILDEAPASDGNDWIGAALRAVRPNAVDAVLDGLRDHVGVRGRVAVDRTGAPELYDLLVARGTEIEFVDRGEDFWRLLRIVKSAAELSALRRVILVNEAAIDIVHTRLGLVEEDSLEGLYAAAVSAGGGSMQHWTGASGAEAGCFRPAPKRVTPVGARFRFDCGLALDGYSSDLGGTAHIGAEPSAEERRTYAALTAGIDEAAAVIRPGLKASELYANVIAAVRAAGLPDYAFSLVGHGVGVEPRELPIIGPPSASNSPFWGERLDPVLESGMVFNIECPLSILGVGGFQHEVTMVVGVDGGRLLSQRRPYRSVAL